MTNPTPYAVMTSILKKNENPTKEQAQILNSFFFVRWLSNNRFTTPIAHVLNTYYNIPLEVQLRFANDYTELTGLRNKVKFIGFNKAQVSPEMKKILDNISRRYKVSETTAQEYFDLMDNKERDRIYTLYDEGIDK